MVDWMAAYRKVSSLTGVRLEDTVSESYALVTNGDSEHHGRVGVYRDSNGQSIYVKFKGIRGLVEFDTSKENNEVIWSMNVPDLLKSRDNLYKLFPD